MALAIFTVTSSWATEKAKPAAENKANPEVKKTATQNFDDTIFDWSGTFAEVIRISGEKHFSIKNPAGSMTKAINAFATSLDPHSSFLDPKTYKAILETTSGQFFGIGIVIDNTRSPKDKFLTAISTVPNGPAEKAGIKAFDKIIEIDDKKLDGMTTEEATAKLRGPKNTKVKLKILRENKKEPLTFEITRNVVKAKTSFAFYIKEYDIYYVCLTTFSSNALKQIKDILEKSSKKPYKGLIIDLRNNSGGLLNSVIDICGLFIEKDSLVVTTKDKYGAKKDEYKTTQPPIANANIPIFILTNNYTASASEILAGCLKIHSQNAAKNTENKPKNKPLVFTVGTKTFGKGSVQEIIPISNNCAIKLTTCLYFLPDNTTIQGKGIEPDFLVEKLFPAPEKVTWFLDHYGREKSLKHSIDPLRIESVEKQDGKQEDKIEKSVKQDSAKDKTDKQSAAKNNDQKSWGDKMKEILLADNQFLETLKLVNIFNLAKEKYPDKVGDRESAVKFIRETGALDTKISMEEVVTE